MRQIIWATLLLIATIATAQAASFDCKKSTTKVEKAICADNTLSQADSDLNKAFIQVRDAYDASKRESLIKGQRNWMKLRSIACITQHNPVADDKLSECLLSVYQERLNELHELLAIQKTYTANDIKLAGDIERVLDKKILSSEGYETELRPFGSIEELYEYRPETCRELYTLNAGIWQYAQDNVALKVYEHAFASCSYEIFKTQSYSSKLINKPVVNFSDIQQFSVEFAYVDAVHNHNFGKKDIMSFKQAIALGKMKLSHDRQSAADSCSSFDDKNNSTLFIVDRNRFQVECLAHAFTISPVGNYTGQGRQEVIMTMGSFPVMGSMYLETTLVAYYDPDTKSIRPDLISPKSRLRLETADHADSK